MALAVCPHRFYRPHLTYLSILTDIKMIPTTIEPPFTVHLHQFQRSKTAALLSGRAVNKSFHKFSSFSVSVITSVPFTVITVSVAIAILLIFILISTGNQADKAFKDSYNPFCSFLHNKRRYKKPYKTVVIKQIHYPSSHISVPLFQTSEFRAL